MRVYHVELVRTPRNHLELHENRRVKILHRRVEPQRARPDRLELGFRLAVAGGEQRDVVAEFDQCIGEVGDHALRAAVKFRRHGFGQWRDLCNFHGAIFMLNVCATVELFY